jgi:hypothetical protein
MSDDEITLNTGEKRYYLEKEKKKMQPCDIHSQDSECTNRATSDSCSFTETEPPTLRSDTIPCPFAACTDSVVHDLADYSRE